MKFNRCIYTMPCTCQCRCEAMKAKRKAARAIKDLSPKEKIKVYRARYAAKHPEYDKKKRSDVNRTYYQKNKERLKADKRRKYAEKKAKREAEKAEREAANSE